MIRALPMVSQNHASLELNLYGFPNGQRPSQSGFALDAGLMMGPSKSGLCLCAELEPWLTKVTFSGDLNTLKSIPRVSRGPRETLSNPEPSNCPQVR